MKDIKDKAEIAASLLKGLANEHRLMILCELVQGERNVTSLIESTGIAQTSMSQHLNKLKDEDIVTYRREHRTLYYSICNPHVLEIMNILHKAFCNNEGDRNDT